MRKDIAKTIVSVAIWLLIVCVASATPECGCDCPLPIPTKVILWIVIMSSALGISAVVSKLIDWGTE